jgi:hypothetical protein
MTKDQITLNQKSRLNSERFSQNYFYETLETAIPVHVSLCDGYPLLCSGAHVHDDMMCFSSLMDDLHISPCSVVQAWDECSY